MPGNNELQIFSDFNCTWCYFDKPLISRLRSEYDIKVIWRAFPLHPDIPAEGLLIADLFGNNTPLMIDKMQQLENKAFSLGLSLAKRKTISDTRLAQELAKWAETKGRLKEYHDAVYQAYFADGLNIADRSVLLDVAEVSKLSREEARSVIEERSFSYAVDMDWEKSEKLKIRVAPTYLLNQDRLVGSQPYEKLEALLMKNGLEKRTMNYPGHW
jgi:predicted DsbA family dithiol-disulfide isomerase